MGTALLNQGRTEEGEGGERRRKRTEGIGDGMKMMTDIMRGRERER